MKKADVMDSINKNSFLARCGIEFEQVVLKEFSGNALVYDEIGGMSCIVVVLKGKIDVCSITIDAKEVILRKLKSGDCFGVSNLFTKTSLNTVLKCKTKSTLVYIPKQIILNRLNEDKDLTFKYCEFCNNRIDFLLKRIEFLTIQSAKSKVCEFILEEAGENSDILLVFSKEELSRRLNISRSALFRELAFLQNEEIIRIEKKRVIILDKAKLKNVANNY